MRDLKHIALTQPGAGEMVWPVRAAAQHTAGAIFGSPRSTKINPCALSGGLPKGESP